MEDVAGRYGRFCPRWPRTMLYRRLSLSYSEMSAGRLYRQMALSADATPNDAMLRSAMIFRRDSHGITSASRRALSCPPTRFSAYEYAYAAGARADASMSAAGEMTFLPIFDVFTSPLCCPRRSPCARCLRILILLLDADYVAAAI